MKILVMEVTIRVSWVNSLKEKRMIVRSITGKLANKFNISVSETANNDEHKLITIGMAVVSTSTKILEATSEKIVDFIDAHNDGEILDIYSDIEGI